MRREQWVSSPYVSFLSKHSDIRFRTVMEEAKLKEQTQWKHAGRRICSGLSMSRTVLFLLVEERAERCEYVAEVPPLYYSKDDKTHW